MAYTTATAVNKDAFKRLPYIGIKSGQGSGSFGNGIFSDAWKIAPTGSAWAAGATAATGSGETLDSTSVGAFPIPPSQAGLSRYLLRARLRTVSSTTNVSYPALLSDRLVQTSGLSANIATPQTVNTVGLPSRASTGEGVIACLVTWTTATSFGSTSSVVFNYTNQAGVSGQVSPSQVIPASTTGLFPLALAAGDTGIQSVQSVTLTSPATTAGNLGILLMRPLLWLQVGDDDVQANNGEQDWTKDHFLTALCPIANDACLMAMWGIGSATGNNVYLDLGFGYA